MKRIYFAAAVLAVSGCDPVIQNKDPMKIELVTSDISNFWTAFQAAKPQFDPAVFQEQYIDKGTKGLHGFMDGRIKNSEHLANVVKSKSEYYASIRESTERIPEMKPAIVASMVKLKQLYPPAIFPPVYFVIGTMNSGGTTGGGGLIIGTEMYGLTAQTPRAGLSEWLLTVLKPVDEIPHIVTHELVHFQQKYDGGNLLEACIKEGAADFVAELVSGKHINQHVHDFANPKEKELWIEFKERMHEKKYEGWLYSASPGRPNDLGYWMGYQITKAYYDAHSSKQQAIDDIMNISDFDKFLAESKYAEKFQ